MRKFKCAERRNTLQRYRAFLDAVRLREGITSVLDMSRRGNQYIQSQQPWALLKTNKEEDRFVEASEGKQTIEGTCRRRATTAVALTCQLCNLLAACLQPFMPATAAELRHQLGLKGDKGDVVTVPKHFTLTLSEGHKLGKVNAMN